MNTVDTANTVDTVDTVDDLGHAVPVPSSVRRVVSLVPSLTETVAVTAPGLLVGATNWCSEPAGLEVTRVRGTKNPDVDRVLALQPDVVLANEEENREPDLTALRAAGLAVWVTAPRDVPSALRSLDRMLRLACRVPRPEWLDQAERSWADLQPSVQRRAIVPIWRRPWMTLGRETFAGDVLSRLGVTNVLAGADDRYPKVDLAALPAYDLVVLPDEPYEFGPADGPEVFPDVDVALVNGRQLTWYGPSLVTAPAVLSAQLAAAKPGADYV